MKLVTCFRCQNKLFIYTLCVLFAAPNSFAQSGRSQSLENLLRLAHEKSESFQAIDRTIGALEAEIRARDLDLSATLTADLSDTNDQRLTVNGQRPIGHRQLFETTLQKPFATGTNVSLTLSHQLVDLPALGENNQVANWEISLSQDLWRNAFGRSTRLRRESDQAELKSRKLTAYNSRQQLVVDTEAIYWDLALALKEEQIRSANIQRSEELAKWVRERVRKYAAENTDLLQVQALMSQRKLELLDARNRIEAFKNKLQQLLPSSEAANFQPDLNSLEQNRSLMTLLAGPTSKETSPPQNLTALASQYRYDQLKTAAARTEDTLRPSLQAYVSHGRNVIDNSVPTSWDQATSQNNPATTVGVRLSMELDSELKADRRKAAELSAEAAALESQAQARTGALGWSDLERQIQNLRSQTEEAKSLANFQRRKSAEEHRRYRQGRTTAFQAITFESDAAAAELRLYQLFASLRKTESQARRFLSANEVDL